MKIFAMIALSIALSAPWGENAVSQNLIIKHFGAQDSLKKYSANTTVLEVVKGSQPISSTSIRQDDKVQIIVELSSPIRKSTLGVSGTKSTTAALQQSSFSNSVSAVSPTAAISHHFSEVINAVSMTASRKDIGAIAGLPGVTNIYEDKRVSALTLRTSSANENPSAQTASDTSKVSRIRIGVIDTGIDYLHEAFGGGFGTGFTVEGGYNFVADNSDPRDDNGHGTHVAGIIAANSPSFKGVAPGSRLFAYKVLDAGGNGSTSMVIAAIEQAIRDSVQIINLSLGTPDGDPDDILSRSVDLAVDAGVVVVVAAGNDGNYGTIASPGAAREALTVGATDINNAVASFSSKGPSNKIYGFKPDIVAPGESILSAKMNGGYVRMSGTSMAAPYVTGMVARLKELHPAWSAVQLRDAILASAKDLGAPVFAEGRGTLDTAKAAAAASAITPASISFGFDNPSTAKWTRTDTLSISNMSREPKTYSFQVQTARTGIALSFLPARLTVNANESRYVVVELTADNSSLPDNSVFSDGYSGSIYAVSTSDTLIVPYLFFKGSVFQISFSETPFQVVIHDQKSNAYYFNPTGTFLSAFVPAGVYDIVTAFTGSAFVVKEDVVPGALPDIWISRDQAIHEVNIFPTDEDDIPLASAGPHLTCSYVQALRHTSSGISEVILGGGNVETETLDQRFFFSDLSARYSFGYALNVQRGNTESYTYDVELDSGIASDRTVRFAPSDLKRIDFKYDVDFTTPRIFPVIWSAFAPSAGIIAVTYIDGDSPPLTYPFIQTGYYTRRVSMKFPILHYREAYKY